MRDESKFWTRLSKRYAKSKISNPELYEKKIQKTIDVLPDDATIFEVGCGTGTTALKLAPHVRQVFASDFSSGMIEIAKQKAHDAGITNVEFTQRSISDYNKINARYDAVLAHNVLHLLRDYDQAIGIAFNALKPNGVFISSTACLGDTATWLKYLAPVGRWLRLLPTVVMIKEDDLLRCLKACGFSIEHSHRENNADTLFIIARKPIA